MGFHFHLDVTVALLGYSTCSLSMVLFNKMLVDTYDVKYPMGLLFLQSLASIILVSIAKLLGLISYPAFSMKIAWQWLPLTFFFVLMLFTSMMSLETMSVAAQTILKQFSTILTCLGDAYIFGKRLSVPIFLSFGLMIFGGYLGSAEDRWVTPMGVFWTLSNVLVTAGYILYMKALLRSVSGEIGRYGPVFYNNLLAMPCLLIAAAPTLPQLYPAMMAAPTGAWICLAGMTSVAAFMTFSTFWAMAVSTPTTYSITGSLNKIPLSLLGMIIFHQWPTPKGAAGIACGLGAGVLYTYLSIQTPKHPEADKKAEEKGETAPLLKKSPSGVSGGTGYHPGGGGTKGDSPFKAGGSTGKLMEDSMDTNERDQDNEVADSVAAEVRANGVNREKAQNGSTVVEMSDTPSEQESTK